MRKKLLFIIIFIIQGIIQAQNLVPNCSFEDTINCPDAVAQIRECKYWYSAGSEYSSPDYFKDCGEYPSVPHNQFGFQYASTGNSYVGIIPYYKNATLQIGKEFIGIKLISPLNISQTYYVSFKVSFTISYQNCYASNKLGILFSTLKYDNLHPAPIKNFAHVYSNKIITDTLNWFKISGLYTPDSIYQYLTIGNFFDINNTDTLKIYQGPSYTDLSYYYIDDICVSLDSTKCLCTSGELINKYKKENLFSAYYNTESKKIIINNFSSLNEKFELRIYDISGRQLNKIYLQKRHNEIATDNFIKGIYLINIRTTTTLYNFKIIIN